MKSSVIIRVVLLIIVFGMACSKRQTAVPKNNPPVSKLNIIGQWQWIESISGWGGIEKPNVDSVVRLNFAIDSSYTVTLNDQVKYAGHFSSFISPTQDSTFVLHCDQNISVHRLRFWDQEAIIYFQNDSCRFYDYELMDGSSHLFIRVK